MYIVLSKIFNWDNNMIICIFWKKVPRPAGNLTQPVTGSRPVSWETLVSKSLLHPVARACFQLAKKQMLLKYRLLLLSRLHLSRFPCPIFCHQYLQLFGLGSILSRLLLFYFPLTYYFPFRHLIPSINQFHQPIITTGMCKVYRYRYSFWANLVTFDIWFLDMSGQHSALLIFLSRY